MTHSKHGGVRQGAGRPKISDATQKRRNVSLSDAHVAKAKLLGKGNISEGIRRALDGR